MPRTEDSEHFKIGKYQGFGNGKRKIVFNKEENGELRESGSQEKFARKNFDISFDGIGEMEISGSPPKVQRPKPDRTPPKNPQTPKPWSGSGSVLRTLAVVYEGEDTYFTNKEVQEMVSNFCDGYYRPTKDAVDTALSPNSLQRRGWIKKQKNTYCITQSGLEIAEKIEQALNQEVTSERDNTENDEQMNTEEETIIEIIDISEIPLPPDDVEVTGDAESEELIPKEEVDEILDSAMEDASDASEDASQLVEVTMRIEPSPRVSKPPKFNGAPGFILRSLDKFYIEGKQYNKWGIQMAVAKFCESLYLNLESIPTPFAIQGALRTKSTKNSTRTLQENGWISKNQDEYRITESGREIADKLNKEAAAYKNFRGNSAPAGQE